ncbi:MAG: DUF4287 domain-containing protein [Candidatus Promineofilum sp.]|jgi:hypothetical protein|nr:DUF4287 domain-containing protein [Promineifilum sp.]
MTIQAHLDKIQAKTGNSPEAFQALAAERGLTTFRDVKAWLKSAYGLDDGHANLVAHIVVTAGQPEMSTDEKVTARFSGNKAHWRASYDAIIAYVSGFGNDFRVAPTTTYISLVRKGKKFAIVDPATAARLDVGLKLKGIEPTDRLTPAGSWNSMVTHRVRVGAPDEIDAELLAWLRQAYDAA